MSDQSSRELFDQFLAGREEEAAADIFDRYVERLLALARTRIGAKLRRRIDPEDVVQSAYRSFFLHAQNHEYQLGRSGDLWRLLASTTLNKLYGQIEKQTAAKRSIHREAAEDAALAGLATREPTIADAIAVAEQLSLVLADLSADERFVLTSTLQGLESGDIAKALGKSERTVRRLAAQAKSHFERQLLDQSHGRKHRTAPCSRSSVEPLAPLRFDNYVLDRLLGSGGMGKVYRATNKRSGKVVAVKSLHKSRQHDGRAVALFVQESQVLARLRHPNIVGVEGLGRFPSGGYFMVMEFIDGIDLETRLSSGPLPVAEAVSICRNVAAAVRYAHDQGVIHCDLKPANVLVQSDGGVFVTDFGFAYLADMSSARERPIGGTAGYIAPEVINLQSPPTRAADVFAIGAMLWTLVTGHVPMSLDQIQTENHEVQPIVGVCRRCLAEEPAERYPSVSEIMDSLLAGESD